jgi:hypothetical protein
MVSGELPPVFQHVRVATAGLAGQGASPSERRRSLQQDLTTMTIDRLFDNGTCWHDLRCLTSIRLEAPVYEDCLYGLYRRCLKAALRATPLVRLEVSGHMFEQYLRLLLSQVSGLRSLTHLAVASDFYGGAGFNAALHEGITPLSRLQQLHLAVIRMTDPFVINHSVTKIPPTAPRPVLALPSSQLASLTSVRLSRFALDSHWPVALGAVRDLELLECELDSRAALSACCQLTRLVNIESAYRRNKVVNVPESWREGLCSLEWRDRSTHRERSWSWLQELKGITRLCIVDSTGGTTNRCWCASTPYALIGSHCRLVETGAQLAHMTVASPHVSCLHSSCMPCDQLDNWITAHSVFKQPPDCTMGEADMGVHSPSCNM